MPGFMVTVTGIRFSMTSVVFIMTHSTLQIKMCAEIKFPGYRAFNYIGGIAFDEN